MLLFNKQNYLLALLFGVFIASCAFEPAWIAKDNKIKILWQRVDLREPITSNEFRLNRYLASRIGMPRMQSFSWNMNYLRKPNELHYLLMEKHIEFAF